MPYLIDSDVLIDITLVTKNRRHFGAIKGLRLEIPGY
jgi:predicted nucleic acid-binding protein